MEIIYRRITSEDLNEKLFSQFNRYQEVTKSWRPENGEWVLKDTPYSEDWTCEEKARLVLYLKLTLASGGNLFGAFKDNSLIGFASLESKFFGRTQEYLQLSAIHISHESRRQKIGHKLFKLCLEQAKAKGAAKIYISTHPAYETQLFYSSLGCVDAAEIKEDLAKLNPNDRQLEYGL